MKRTLLVSGVLPFVSAFLGGVLAVNVAVPHVAGAQEARIRAESVEVVGAGTERLHLGTKWDGQASDISLFAPDGTRQLAMGAGGLNVADPEGSGISIYLPDGIQVARFGTGHGPQANLPLTTQTFLNDRSGQTRIRLSVAEDGTPAMLMYDADGVVIWSAP